MLFDIVMYDIIHYVYMYTKYKIQDFFKNVSNSYKSLNLTFPLIVMLVI